MLSYFYGILLVLLCTALAVVGMLAVRKYVGLTALASNHEVGGYLLSIIGTLYAVLLGFVIVDAMQHVQDLRVLVEQEAGSLANIFLCADGLDDADKLRIRGHCFSYAKAVVNEEWPAMAKGRYSTEAFNCAWALWKDVTHLDPKTDPQKNLHQQLISEICNMTQNRRTRLVNARHGVAPVLWVVLIVGGLFTVAFTYFFGVENIRAQVIMTILVSLTLSLNVFLVFVFGYPFSGGASLQPDAFMLDLLIFQNFSDSHKPLPDHAQLKDLKEILQLVPPQGQK